MYRISEYEIVKLNNNKFLLANLVNGCADILDDETAHYFDNNLITRLNGQTLEQMLDREYLFPTQADYLSFLETHNNTLYRQLKTHAPNYIYIPSYTCNLDCYYCFEKAYEKTAQMNRNSENSLNDFFSFCNSIRYDLEKSNNHIFNNRDILITITGGEPLLKENYSQIEMILSWCKENNYLVSIVTNGTNINEYLPLFTRYPIDELQVTLDGSQNIHDSIRIGKNGEPTFKSIIDNILLLDGILQNIYVRINITKKNIYSIIDLGSIMEMLPNVHFYTYLMQQEGCSDDNNIIEEIEGLKLLWELKKKDNRFGNMIIEYHGRDFIESLYGLRKFHPLVKVCSAMQNQFIVDKSGSIYKCWWGMGNEEYTIGNINQNGKSKLDNNMIELYRTRDISTLSKCSKCKYRYLCGGGCSGRLTKQQLINRDVICPDFHSILSYMIPELYDIEVE